MKTVLLAALTLLCTTASAGEVFDESVGLVEFLPISDVVADGRSVIPI